jgi:integrase
MKSARGVPRTERGGVVNLSPHQQRLYAARGSTRGKCPERSDHRLHTAATLALIQGVHPKVVSDMLGHGTVGLTLDTYSHLLPAMHQQAAAAMDAILAG